MNENKKMFIKTIVQFPFDEGNDIIHRFIEEDEYSLKRMYIKLENLWLKYYPLGEDNLHWGGMDFERFLAILFLMWPTPEFEVRGRYTDDWDALKRKNNGTCIEPYGPYSVKQMRVLPEYQKWLKTYGWDDLDPETWISWATGFYPKNTKLREDIEFRARRIGHDYFDAEAEI